MDKKMNSKVDFSLLLASSVHDMKNSIGMLLSTVEELDQSMISSDQNSKSQLALLHAKAARINNDLVHLLGVYRMDQEQLILSYDECYLTDLFQDQIANNEIIFSAGNLEVIIDCDESICWYFDEQLVTDVINNVLINAAKYANKLIRLKAEIVNEYLKISVWDDGRGYPENMLTDPDALKKGINFSTGSTQLGLFFASRIAEEHTNDDRKGYIHLENSDGGGLFSIWLP